MGMFEEEAVERFEACRECRRGEGRMGWEGEARADAAPAAVGGKEEEEGSGRRLRCLDLVEVEGGA